MLHAALWYSNKTGVHTEASGCRDGCIAVVPIILAYSRQVQLQDALTLRYAMCCAMHVRCADRWGVR